MTTLYSEKHVSLLLAMMLKSKGVAEAASALDPRYLITPAVGGNHGQAALFKTLKDLWLRYKELPDLVAVMADITARTERLGSSTVAVEQIHAEFHNLEYLLPRLTEATATRVREFIVYILQTCAIDPRAKEIGAEMMVSGATPALVAEIDVLNNRVASITGSNVVTGLLRRPRPKVGGRLHLGVPWLDSLFPDGAGPVRGSCVGIIAPQNGGKCLGKGTPVRLFDGSVKPVEDIVAGDHLMGPDSKPRKVLGTTRGRGELFKIAPRWCDSFVCNDVHVLTLVNIDTDEIVDIPLDKYQLQSVNWKLRHKLFRAAVSYPAAPTRLDPYVIGVWLGDGHKEGGAPLITKNDDVLLDFLCGYARTFGLHPYIRVDERNNVKTAVLTGEASGGTVKNPLREGFKECISPEGEKRIPRQYMVNSVEVRRKLLAGLVDTDGYASKAGVVEITSKYVGLALDIKELALSLGFNVSEAVKTVKGRDYQRLNISGDFRDIPCLLERKKAGTITNKRYRGNRSRFDVESLGLGDYYGFELDGDGRFLLGDFTVTHNTTMGIQLAVSQALQGNRALLVLVEEGITIPLQCKLFAAALDCPWDAIQRHMGADREMLDAVEDVIDEYKLDRETAHRKLEAIDKYLTVMDIANNENAGLITIETTILNAHESGKGFELVYIDWAGLIADRMLAGVEVPRAYTSKEDALKQVGVFFAKTAASANNVITISQQMAVIYAAQPYRMFDTYCAADCKMFTQSLKYAFAIGKSDKDGLSVLTLIKARDDKKGIPTIVRLNGAHARFEDCRDTHFFQPANTGVKGRIKRKESNEARVPQEAR